ncbi:uncharacterized protein [Onthophagus taurus]|uniref:uncharacterized protein isoform X1 n=2 Tax=Onthophagus taurus TaxID=166361 RepID=UPI0039BE6528
MSENGSVELLLPSLVVAVVVGAAFLLLRYVLSVVQNANPDEVPRKIEKNAKEVSDQKRQSQTHIVSNKKKKTIDNRLGRNDKTFTDKWLKTSMKGHTGQVLDMDYSSNGRLLASCSDEDDSASKTSISTDGDSNLSSEYLEEEEDQEKKQDVKPQLSRRQRKNRKRDENASPVLKSNKARGKKSIEKNFKHEPSLFYEKLGVPDVDLTSFLHSYLLSTEQMLALGYPMDSSQDPGKVIIFKGNMGGFWGKNDNNKKKKTFFDVNAKEFYPRSYTKKEINEDSGRDSGNSSECEEDVKSNPKIEENYIYNSILERSELISIYNKKEVRNNKKNCCRCGDDFYLNPEDSGYITQEPCTYHWGKLTMFHPTSLGVLKYQCCGGFEGSQGCTQGKLHVWTGINAGVNGPFDNYVKTKPRKTTPPGGNTGAYAIDCEMCFTVKGMELVKVTVIGCDGRLVYDTFVKPEMNVVDYNSRFSGITAKDLNKKKNPKSLREVQNDLMGFIFSDTILIGHGLENDLRVLKILHPTVVDTAVAFPHRNGLPYRRSLKQLASCFLKRDIQTNSEGHDSFEDARACIDLMLMRIGRDFQSILQHSYQL